MHALARTGQFVGRSTRRFSEPRLKLHIHGDYLIQMFLHILDEHFRELSNSESASWKIVLWLFRIFLELTHTGALPGNFVFHI